MRLKKKNDLVAEKYLIEKLIGKGSFGETYSGENTITHQKVALKFEPINNQIFSSNTQLPSEETKNPVLLYECRILRCLNGATGFPSIYWYGIYDKFNSNVIVMDLLNQSLSSLQKDANNKIKPFSLKTVLMITDQLITRLEFLHKKGFIHGDIKPENMLLGRGNNSNVVYLIDFGLSQRFIDENGKHVSYSEDSRIFGTPRYLSINSHLGIRLTRRDDMESLGYVLIYFLKGKLPWQGLSKAIKKTKDNPKLELYTKIAEIKMKTPLEELCEGIPNEFLTYLQQVRSLRFEDEPDYVFYRKLFRSLFIRSGFIYDMKFDWSL